MARTPQPAAQADAVSDVTVRPDRRARRRQETLGEILDIARDVMTTEGVNGLSLAEVARRLGVQPPSLYKYFPSLMAIYDALFFEQGQRDIVEAMCAAMARVEPGLDALIAGLEACGRWSLANRAVAELAVLAPRAELSPLTRGLRGQRGDGGAPARRARRRGGGRPARTRRGRRRTLSIWSRR